MKTKIPLLKDNHNHPSLYTVMSRGVDLRLASSKEEAIEAIILSGAMLPPGRLTIVYGWNDARFVFTEEELDSLPPVYISNESLHGFLINASARELLGPGYAEITASITDKAWVERNLPAIMQFMVEIAPFGGADIKEFYDGLLGEGVWYAEEMLLPGRSVLQAFEEAGLLERTAFWADLETYRSLDAESRTRVRGIKVFTDGALGARTAAISGGFLPGGEGMLRYGREELASLIGGVLDTGKEVSIHAIGDRALDQVLSVLEECMAENGRMPAARLEHCQFITLQQARRARELGAVLSMQPNFSYDSVQYADRLPGVLLEKNNPFRMLIDEAGFIPGDGLVFGSDGMPHGAQRALEMSLFPPHEGQKLTLEEFVAGYCMPGPENGQIDVDIDEDSGTVKTEISIEQT